MSAMQDILAGLHTLTASALPQADVRGFIESTAKPERLGGGGTVIGAPGDPGQPEYDLSPVAYTYTHHIPVEVTAGPAAAEADLYTMLGAIGSAVLANRTLGGLVTWLDVTAATISDEDAEGTATLRVASIEFIAEYTVSNPLAA